MDILLLRNYGQFILIFSGILAAGGMLFAWIHYSRNKNWKEQYRKL